MARRKERRNIAEEEIEKILRQMQDEKKIAGFLKNRPNDRLDAEGIDFLIILNNGLAMPLQVKTESRRGHYDGLFREHKRKHPLIKFLICVPIKFINSDPEKMYKRIRSDIEAIMRKTEPR